jgi:hypothetical protein
MAKYKLIEENVVIASQKCKCYGVCACNGNTFNSLTFNKEQAQRLVCEFNENNIELCHFKDVVQDFLDEITTTEIRFIE